MKFHLAVELNEDQYARLQAVAKDRGLTPDEAVRRMVFMSINRRHRELQIEESMGCGENPTDR